MTAVDTGPTLIDHATSLATIHTMQDTAMGNDIKSLFTAHSGAADFGKTVHALLPEMISQHAQASALITAQWYDEIDPSSKFRAKPYGDIPAGQLEKSINWGLYAPGEQAPVDRLTGDAKRIVRNSSRNTVVTNASKEGIRYARFAQPKACSWCRALAVRSTGKADRKYLYYSDKSAIYKNDNPSEKYHTNCDCEAVPIRGGTVWTPPDYASGWQAEYNAVAKTIPSGKNYFQRVTSKMRSLEPPTDEEVAAATAKVAAKKQALADHVKAFDVAQAAAKKVAMHADLENAKDWSAVEDVATQMLPNTNVDFGDVIHDLSKANNRSVPDTAVARDIVHAVDDVMTAYPKVRLDNLEIRPLVNPNTYARTLTQLTKPRTSTVQMNRTHSDNPADFQRKWDANVASGFHHDTAGYSPTYGVIVHEMGHVIEEMGAANGVDIDDFMVMTAMSDYYRATKPFIPGQSLADREQEFRAWLIAGTSGYSRQDGGAGTSIALDVPEALAEAFVDVFINGDDAQEPSQVMNKILTDALEGVSYWEARQDVAAA